MSRFSDKLPACVRSGHAYLARLVGFGCLVLLGLLALPMALLLICLPAAIRIPMGRRLISQFLTGYLLFLKLFCDVRVDSTALEKIRVDGPLIIIANHPSLLDAVVLLARLPRAVCVMKGSLKRNIFVWSDGAPVGLYQQRRPDDADPADL